MAPLVLAPLVLAPVGSCAGPLQFEALLRRASTGIGPVAAPPAHFAMATSVLSPFCRPEEDPFLLLQSTLSCVERILKLSVGQPLRRTWIEHPYGEEEITLLEEEVLPAIQQCLQRVDAIDRVLLEEQDAQIALEQLRQELAAKAEGADADEALSPR
jgi:hypothetical protein